MEAGLSPVSCCRQTFFARSCYGLALWAGRIWLPHPFWSVGLQPSGSAGAARPASEASTLKAVTPADFVELRALEGRKEELRLQAREEPEQASRTPEQRFWPFRWPETPPVPIEPAPPGVAPERRATAFDILA